MKQSRRDKGRAWAAITLLVLSMLTPCLGFAQNGSAAWQVEEDNQVIRLHVRAGGDSPAEQQFKMALVPQVQQFLSRKVLLPGENYSSYCELLRCSLPELEKELQRFADLQAGGVTVAVDLGWERFPLRNYGRRIYPAGLYRALVITVGEGGGENWWCLLFPPLCLPPAEAKGEASPDDETDPAKVGPTGETANFPGSKKRAEPVLWRSKVWELLKNRGQSVIEKAEEIFYN